MLRRLWLRLRALRQRGKISHWDFCERRELVRLRCHLEISYSLGDKSYFGQILDMSLGGMLLRCLQPPGVASLIKITYVNETQEAKENTIRCRVQWVKANSRDFTYFVGLSYCDSEDILRHSWVKMELHRLGFNPHKIFQKRKHVRAYCFIPAQIYGKEADCEEGRLYNLGASGALLESSAAFDKGQTIKLLIGPLQQLKAFTIHGKVAARTEVNQLQFIGIEFEQVPLSTQALLSAYLQALIDEGTLG